MASGRGPRRIDYTTRTVLVRYYNFPDIRLEYTSNLIDYRGVHITHDAATDDEEWEVWKYTWSGNDCVRIEGPLIGAWDDRATLDWGS